jgi:hypothetical protein
MKESGCVMTKPIPDKAEVALEYPDKHYILEVTGISLSLERTGGADMRKTIHMHFHYGLFAEILRELGKTASSVASDQIDHRDNLREAAKELWQALDGQVEQAASRSAKLDSLTPAHAGETGSQK